MILPLPPPAKLPFLIGAEWSLNAPKAAQERFLETGCNFVRLTGGGYGWATQPHVDALKLLEPRGIQALVQLGSHYPDGKYLDHKEDYFVDDKGESGEKQGWAVTYGGQSWPQMTYASEGYRKGLEGDFGAYLKAVSPYRNVKGLLLHNEPGYFWIDGRVFDYNPQAVARFRAWLPGQHASIADLNRRWGTAFPSFEAVEPPKERPPVANLAAWMDWRRFNRDLIQGFLGWEAGFARRERPDLPNMTNLAGPLDNWFPLRLGDNYRFASASDAACIDIYATQWTDRYFSGYAMDMTHGAAHGRPVVVAECESYDPRSFTGISPEGLGDRLKSDLWSFIGHGARGILIWTLSGQNGFHLTDGEFNPRLAALRETAHLAKMVELDDFARPRPKVALVADQDAFLLFGGALKDRDGAALVQGELHGLYAALVHGGHDVDIVSADDVREGRGKGYRALVLACPVADAALAKGLTGFVQGGGTLVVDPPFARWDRWGAPVSWPSLGLSSLFGSMIAAPATSPTQYDWAKEERPAVVSHTLGKGRAVLLSRNAGRLGPELSTVALLKSLLPASTRPLTVETMGFVDASRLVDARGNTLVVLVNPSDAKKPLVPQKDVRLGVRVWEGWPYTFGTSSAADGSTVTGARPFDATKPFTLTSATPILFAKDHAPLLGMRLRPDAAKGMAAIVQVTVYNPSPRPATGRVSLQLPTGWKGGSKTIRLAPNARATVDLTFTPIAPLPRVTVKPVLTLPNGKTIFGTPADVAVHP